MADHRGNDSDGFTLIEVLISLVLFALISLAGISLIQTIVDVQTRTEARGHRLAQVQRAVYLLSADFEQMTQGPVIENGTVRILRSGAFGEYTVGYTFKDGVLRRSSGERSVPVIDGIDNLAIRVLVDNQWAAISQDAAQTTFPRAVEVTFMLAARPNASNGPVRRVIELPVPAQ